MTGCDNEGGILTITSGSVTVTLLGPVKCPDLEVLE